jgi:hypothetical protein
MFAQVKATRAAPCKAGLGKQAHSPRKVKLMATVTNLRNVLQAVPDRASETIEKLSNTSANAKATRERLTSELVSDLRLYTDLEEQHLFPAARKAPEAKALVPKAMNEQKQLRARLDEIEGEPKDNDDFLEHVSALKRDFEERLREDRRDLLPAVTKALDRNEVQEMIDRIETAIREADKAKREETANRRRETDADEGDRSIGAEAVKTAADSARDVAEGFAEQGRKAAESISEAMLIERRTVESTMRDFSAASAALSNVTQPLAEMSSAWADLISGNLQTNIQLARRLTQCRNLSDLFEVQREFTSETMRGWMERNARMFEAMQRASTQALRPLRERERERK